MQLPVTYVVSRISYRLKKYLKDSRLIQICVFLWVILRFAKWLKLTLLRYWATKGVIMTPHLPNTSRDPEAIDLMYVGKYWNEIITQLTYNSHNQTGDEFFWTN